MKKYLLIFLLPLLNLTHATGDFSIRADLDFWIVAIPLGIIALILAIIFISGGNPPKNTNEDKELKEKVQKDQNNKNTQ